jgi:DNA-directed RNA polymerase sigma subunit (sigma70/sigma32)
MTSFLWPAEDGWPYPDSGTEAVDLTAESDDDLLALRIPPPHLFDELDPLERWVVNCHYGLDGSPARTLADLHAELGMTQAEVQGILGSGLAKLRAHLIS